MTQRLLRTSKNVCKNLPPLNLPNERNDLILETDASNEHWSAVLKIKEEENFANIAMKVLIRQNASIS